MSDDDWTPQTEAQQMLKDEIDASDARDERIVRQAEMMYRLLKLMHRKLNDDEPFEMRAGMARMIAEIVGYVEHGS